MQNLVIIIFMMLSTTVLYSINNVLYVSPTGTGNGESWSDASNDLNAVLFKARPGTQVWVAKGTYLPTTDKNRKIAFIIPDKVAVYGGFSGNETFIEQRNIFVNQTILSGNIGKKTHDDNSYNVVYFDKTGPSTILDGFFIQDGNSNGEGTTGARNRCGAGIYNNGAGKGNVSNPTIVNCILWNNVSRDGGGIYNNGIGGEASPKLMFCEFYSNQARFDGGAIFNDGRNGGKCNPTLMSCIIKGNHANYGGAICNYGGKGEANPIYEKCNIDNNTATMQGDGVYNMDIDTKANG